MKQSKPIKGGAKSISGAARQSKTYKAHTPRSRSSPGHVLVQGGSAKLSRKGSDALRVFRLGVQDQLADLAKKGIKTAATINGRAVDVFATKDGGKFVLVEVKSKGGSRIMKGRA